MDANSVRATKGVGRMTHLAGGDGPEHKERGERRALSSREGDTYRRFVGLKHDWQKLIADADEAYQWDRAANLTANVSWRMSDHAKSVGKALADTRAAIAQAMADNPRWGGKVPTSGNWKRGWAWYKPDAKRSGLARRRRKLEHVW